ncbi:MAG: hypothetical protein GF331_20840 [Chitinivibrionales bacterium]|nr:hypothetical protein [Chitinivibrionales bacterium]
MELLAPAGNSDCLHAAIEAGADAVYVGAPAFNARLRAENVSIRALARLVPYAHGKGVRVYTTLNTLLKQRELEPVADLLYQLEQIGVDALIVADLGLIRLARKFFPSLPLHASTQMFVHNRAGLQTAKALGLTRAILARELTLEELTKLAAVSPRPQLEVFVHGALCYSFSGACLASSFLGGSSGNRGRCTQVCRRMFSHPGGRGSVFSLMDLCALPVVPKLRALGVSSLKIEGRMKGATYVHTVVSAYRRVLDNPEQAREAADELRFDMGRDKTCYFLGAPAVSGHISKRPYGGTGVYLGTVKESAAGRLTVASAAPVAEGDKIRVQPPSGYEGRRMRVTGVSGGDGRLDISLADNERYAVGSGVYLVESRARRPSLEGPRLRLPAGRRIHERCPFQDRIKSYTARKRPRSRPASGQSEVYVRLDRLPWLRHVTTDGIAGLILALEARELDRLPTWRDAKLRDKSRVVLALPPFIAPADEDTWRSRIASLTRAGYRRWMVANTGHRGLFDDSRRVAKQGREPRGSSGGVELWADYNVWCLNTPTQDQLRELGFRSFTFSLEDELLNMRICGAPDRAVYLFGRVPLFVSRAEPALAVGSSVRDDRGQRFTLEHRHGLYYLISERPLCLTQRRAKLEEAGVRRFVLDLSFYKPRRDVARGLLSSFHAQKRFNDGSQFNFKAGLK